MGSIALMSPCIPEIVEAEGDVSEEELAEEDPPPPQLIKKIMENK